MCKDAASCTGDHAPKRGLCAGAANIQCCLPKIVAAPAPPAAGECVSATQGVNVRDRATTSGSQVLLLAMAGEQFTKTGESGGWLHVANARGSGWSFGSFWRPRVPRLLTCI